MQARVPLALVLTAALLAACDNEEPKKVAPPVTSGGAPTTQAAPAGGGGPTKEGWFGSGDALHARVEVKGVEQAGDKATARLTVTSLDASAKQAPFPVTLVDPVNRRFYQPTVAPAAVPFAPNTPQEVTVDFPLLTGSPQKVTLLTPGTAGEFTGIPVTAAASTAPTTPPATSATTSPATSLIAAGGATDLYDITEGEIRDVTASGSDVKVNLRTDVLFAFNSAKLSDRAKQVLDDAAKEIKEKADPAKRPLAVTGHTDTKGEDDYNLKLSRERAQAVEKELKSRLDSTFTYTTEGKGEKEPVAKEGDKDDAQARSRNRRVEITYVVRQKTDATTTASTAPATGQGETAPPAAFRADDGAKVASRYGRFGAQKRRLDVKPFYRDGAYLVAVFDLVNEGPDATPADASYPHKDYPGGLFTSFSVQVGKDVYRAVRIGTGTTYLSSLSATFRTAVNEPTRGFVYIPAPPGKPSSVVFDGGPFGKVNNVPVN